MLLDGAQHSRLELLPFAACLGDRKEVRAKEDAGNARDGKEAFGERRLGSGFRVAHVERAACQHRPSGQELEGRRIGGRFSLDEHGSRSLTARADGRGYPPASPANKVAAHRKRSRPPSSPMRRIALRPYDMESRSSSLRLPGTMATGTGNSPA